MDGISILFYRQKPAKPEKEISVLKDALDGMV